MSLVPRFPTHPLERVELYCSSVGLKGGCWCYTTPHTKAKPGLQLSKRGEIKSSSKEELTKTWPNELPNRWRHNKIFLVRQVPMKKKSSSLSYVLSSGRKALTLQALWWIFYQVWFRPWWTWHLSSRKPPRSGNEKALDGMTWLYLWAQMPLYYIRNLTPVAVVVEDRAEQEDLANVFTFKKLRPQSNRTKALASVL